MRVLHTSDWHLGRSLHGHNLLDDQRLLLEQLLALVEQRQVQLLLLAGDVYDRSLPPDGAVALFNEFLERLVGGLGVAAVIIPGNHDSALRLGFGATLLKPAGLHMRTELSAVAEPLRFGSGEDALTIYGLPYASPEMVRTQFNAPQVRSADQAMAHLLGQVRTQLDPSETNLLLAHCFVAGGYTSESERPLSVGGADQVSLEHFDAFDYAALGHLHRPHQQGRAAVRYSGSLLKYSVSEEHHDKSVVLFDATSSGVNNIETVALAPRRNVRTVAGSLAEVLAAAAEDPAVDDYVQIVLDDANALHDVHGRLASVYPNRLQVLRPNVQAPVANAAQALASMERGELAMFNDFYQYSAGRELSSAEQRLVAAAIDALDSSESDADGVVARP